MSEKTTPVVVPGLDAVDADHTGESGVVWTLEGVVDLNANKVVLAADATIGGHVNQEVDVLLYVLSGGGQLVVSDATHHLAPGTLALVPKGTHRAVHAGATGLTYLSIHRRRGPLTIGPRPQLTGDIGAENEHDA